MSRGACGKCALGPPLHLAQKVYFPQLRFHKEQRMSVVKLPNDLKHNFQGSLNMKKIRLSQLHRELEPSWPKTFDQKQHHIFKSFGGSHFEQYTPGRAANLRLLFQILRQTLLFRLEFFFFILLFIIHSFILGSCRDSARVSRCKSIEGFNLGHEII